MHILKSPSWIKDYEFPFKNFKEVPQEVFDSINNNLDRIALMGTPLVSIVITAYNEEVSILRTVGSLANLKTRIPFEIVVVNNNSNDDSQLTLDRLHTPNYFQPIQGWGPGRQMGMEKAQGKYILLADANCIYPDCWLNEMLKALQTPGVVSVYGRYRFIAQKGFARWQLSLLEFSKDIMAEIRHVKRPFLNSYGMSMGFIRELGLKEGFYMNKTHGEDGRMCYDLMKYGKVKQVKSSKARVWTDVRTLQKSGSFTKVFFTRLSKELKRFGIYFNTKMKYHPTKEQQK